MTDCRTNNRIQNLHGSIIPPWLNIEHGFVANFLRIGNPVRTLNVIRKTPVIQENCLAVRMQFSTASKDLAANVYRMVQIFDLLQSLWIDPFNFLPHVRVPTLLISGRHDYPFPLETSQRPMFELLGVAAADKRHKIFESGHIPRERHQWIKEMLDWLDKYLGPVG